MKKDFIVRRSITMVEGKPHIETYSEQELVRCKDCKHSTVSESGLIKCGHVFRMADFFCADGVKRDE